jgi:WD40 repeat protein
LRARAKHTLAAEQECTIRSTSRSGEAEPRTLGSHADVVRTVLWSPDGRYVVSAGGDKHVHVFDVAAGKKHDLKGNTAGVKGLSISPDGKLVASAGIDEIVRVWPIKGGVPRVFLGHRAAVKDVVFTGASDAVISSSEDDHMRVWPLTAPPPPPLGPDLAAWITARTNVQVVAPP